MEHQPSPTTNEERLAARFNLSDGVRRHGPAFAVFAEAVGHLTVARDPELFGRSFVGTWPAIDLFVRDYVIESGLQDQLDRLPPGLRSLVSIDEARVAASLCAELLVLDVDGQTWVFDVQPVVKTTVDKNQPAAHSE